MYAVYKTNVSAGSNQLSGVMQDIWDADVNRLTSNDIIINTAGSR